MLVADSLQRIHSILDIKPLSNNENKANIKDNSIELKNVKFKYENSKINAIDGISLKIKPKSNNSIGRTFW